MATNRRTDTRDHKVGQDQSFAMPAMGSIDPEDFRDNFEVIDSRVTSDQLKAEAFFEEPIDVVISTTDNPTAEAIITLQCNGINQFLLRGVKHTVKRKFVEILARAKAETISTPEYTDAAGNRATKINKTQGLKYPFTVMYDPNPEGPAWLQRVLREGA